MDEISAAEWEADLASITERFGPEAAADLGTREEFNETVARIRRRGRFVREVGGLERAVRALGTGGLSRYVAAREACGA